MVGSEDDQDQRSCYGVVWRQRCRAGLSASRAEYARWREEQDWERANPQAVAKLDSMVGEHVKLRRRMSSVEGSSSYPPGMKLSVIARLGDKLLAESKTYGFMLINHEWVEVSSARSDEAGGS